MANQIMVDLIPNISKFKKEINSILKDFSPKVNLTFNKSGINKIKKEIQNKFQNIKINFSSNSKVINDIRKNLSEKIGKNLNLKIKTTSNSIKALKEQIEKGLGTIIVNVKGANKQNAPNIPNANTEVAGRNSATSFANAFSQKLATFGAAAYGLQALSNTIKSFTDKMFGSVYETGSKMTGYLNSLKVMLGDEGGSATLKMLEEYAQNAPGDIEKAMEAYMGFVNRGIILTKEQMYAMTDFSSSIGRDINDVQLATTSAMSGNFRRLKTIGIDVSKQGNQLTMSFRGQTQVIKNSRQAIMEYMLALGKSEGVAGSMAKALNTLKGQAERFEDSMIGLKKSIFDSMSDMLLPIFKKFNEILSGTNEKGEEIHKGLFGVIEKIRGSIAQLLIALKSFAVITPIIAGIGLAFSFMLANPLVLKLAAIATAISFLISEIVSFATTGESIMTRLFDKMMVWLGFNIKFKDLFDKIREKVVSFYNKYKEVFESALYYIKIFGKAIIISILTNIRLTIVVWKTFFSVVKAIFNTIKQIIKTVMNFFKTETKVATDSANKDLNTVKTTTEKVGDFMLKVFYTVSDFIIGVFAVIGAFISMIFYTIGQICVATLKTMASTVKLIVTPFSNAFHSIKAVAFSVFAAIAGVMADVFGGMADFVSSANKYTSKVGIHLDDSNLRNVELNSRLKQIEFIGKSINENAQKEEYPLSEYFNDLKDIWSQSGKNIAGEYGKFSKVLSNSIKKVVDPNDNHINFNWGSSTFESDDNDVEHEVGDDNYGEEGSDGKDKKGKDKKTEDLSKYLTHIRLLEGLQEIIKKLGLTVDVLKDIPDFFEPHEKALKEINSRAIKAGVLHTIENVANNSIQNNVENNITTNKTTTNFLNMQRNKSVILKQKVNSVFDESLVQIGGS